MTDTFMTCLRSSWKLRGGPSPETGGNSLSLKEMASPSLPSSCWVVFSQVAASLALIYLCDQKKHFPNSCVNLSWAAFMISLTRFAIRRLHLVEDTGSWHPQWTNPQTSHPPSLELRPPRLTSLHFHKH